MSELPDDYLIEELYRSGKMSTRAYHAFVNQTERSKLGLPYQGDPVVTVGDIRKLSDAELLRLDNFGRKTLEEVRILCGPNAATWNQGELRRRWSNAVRAGRTDLGFSEWLKGAP